MSDSSLDSDPGPGKRPTAAGQQASASGDQPVDDRHSPGGWLLGNWRRERQLKQIGSDPDPRFTWANERTFLAWNRTALALIAAGLAAAQFLHFNLRGLRLIIAVPLIVLGATLALAGYFHWEDSERAMRLRQPLRYSWMPRALAGGIVLIAVCAGILAIVDRLVD